MNFNAEPKIIQDILSLEREYVVPRYQREYSWEEEEQIQEFWEDINEQIDYECIPFKAKEYFIGSLVLIKDTDSKYYIIDGQQRITTITIFLSALVNIGDELAKTAQNGKEYEKFSNTCYRYIEGKDTNDDPFFKLKSENNSEFFPNEIQFRKKNKASKHSIDLSPLENKRLNKAYNFFYNKIKDEIVNGNGKNDPLGFLQVLREQLKLCETIYITVDNKKDSQKIFQTLNAKGKNLEYIDLIKNELFSVLDSTHPSDFAKESWISIKENIQSIKNETLTYFFYQYWNAKYKRASESDIYGSFLDEVECSEEKYNEFLLDLLNSSQQYLKIALPNKEDWKNLEHKEIYESLKKLEVFNIKIARPLILVLLQLWNNKRISLKNLKDILNKISIFHFIHSGITSSPKSGLERSYATYARRIYKCTGDNKEIVTIIRELEAKLKEKLKLIPESLVLDKFTKLSFLKDKETINLIFMHLEMFVYRNTRELSINNMSLEHITPQSQIKGSAKKAWEHRIGNLIPLGPEINSKCDSKSFKAKLKLFEESELEIVRDFVSKYRNSAGWDQKSSEKRAKELASQFYNSIITTFGMK